MLELGATRRTLLGAAGALGIGAGLSRSVHAFVQSEATPTPPPAPTPGWEELGLMQGFPPPLDKRVTLSNWVAEPYIRWAAQHARELLPTAEVANAPEATTPLLPSPRTLGNNDITTDDGVTISLEEVLHLTQTDAFLVLQNGSIADERYFNSMTAESPHILASLTKALVGLLAADLAVEGAIDLDARAAVWVPELAGNPLGEATIAQLLDMQVPLTFPPPGADLGFFLATGMLTRPPGYDGPGTIYDFLLTAQSAGPAGSAFQYETACYEAIAWVLSRATNQSLRQLVAERIWQGIGAEAPGAFVVDPIGTDVASGGFLATARDMARFAEAVRRQDKAGGKRAFAAEAIAMIRSGAADAAPHARELFRASPLEETSPGFSFRFGWWLPNDAQGSLEARGRFGQRVYIGPWSEVTIVQFGSQVGASRYDVLMDRAFQTIVASMVAD